MSLIGVTPTSLMQFYVIPRELKNDVIPVFFHFSWFVLSSIHIVFINIITFVFYSCHRLLAHATRHDMTIRGVCDLSRRRFAGTPNPMAILINFTGNHGRSLNCMYGGPRAYLGSGVRGAESIQTVYFAKLLDWLMERLSTPPLAPDKLHPCW